MYCQKCGTQNPEGANNCQNCGAPLNATPAKKKKKGLTIGIIVGVILLLGIIGSFGNSDKSNKTTSNEVTSTDTASPLGEYSVKIKSAFPTKDRKDKPVVIVTYTFVNHSNKNITWNNAIKAEANQHGVILEEVLTNFDVKLLNDDAKRKTIMPEGTLDVQEAYYLNDESDYIELNVSKSTALKREGYETFKIELNDGDTFYSTDDTLSFSITAEKAGKYGKLLTLNKGTEFEETFYAFYVPEGTYTAINIGEYPGQINVHSDKTRITDAGFEEPMDATAKLISNGESDTISIKKGQHIEINKPDAFVLIKTK